MAVVGADGALLQTTGYYPSGTPYRLPSATIQTPVDAKTDRLHIGNRWLGHSGLAMYDNTARMHDPLLMRYAAPDPLYAKFGSLSPWSHCAANPLNLIDPDGNRPIYSTDGDFLGTDEGGLKGKYVIMKSEDFEQNMSTQLADEHAVKLSSLSTKQMAMIRNHYNKLPSRPDYDGYITWSEATSWSKNGPNEKNGRKAELYADINLLDFSTADISSSTVNFTGLKALCNIIQSYFFNLRPNFYCAQKLYLDLINGHNTVLQQATVYGNVSIDKYRNGRIELSSDVFDFDIHPNNSFKSIIRNTLTKIGQAVAGHGKPFEIRFYGSKKL